jgi:hypothetical protein
MTKHANRIEAIRVLDDLVLEARYGSGQVARVDMTDIASQVPIFAPLRDPEVFRRVTIEHWGQSIAWNEDACIRADRLMEMALEQAGRMDAVTFRRWQERNRLSLTDAATALGMTRRTIAQYRTGARPVPRTVLLALLGWEVEQREANRSAA